MKILMTVFGSLGDLHPMLGLAQALRALGHDITLAASSEHHAKIERHGFSATDLGPSRQQVLDRTGLDLETLFERVSQNHGMMLKDMVLPGIISDVERLRPLARASDLILTSSFAFAGSLLSRLEHRPLVACHLSPAATFSAYDPPLTKAAPFWPRPQNALGVLWNRALAWAGQRVMAAPLSELRRTERHFGLRPQKIGLGGLVGDELTLGLYAPELAPAMPDDPKGMVRVGAAYLEGEDSAHALADRVQGFLEREPLVFTLGSTAVITGTGFYREAIKAAKALNQPALLLVGEMSPLFGEELGPDVLALPYAPHDQVFPRARVIIHHGGAGGTAQALKTGKPQLVVPMFADQFDNAERVQRIGDGQWVSGPGITTDQMIKTLRPLLDAPTQTPIGVENGAKKGAALVDGLFGG